MKIGKDHKDLWGEEKMEQGRVLIISDSPDRRSFLEYHVGSHGLLPVWYPNIMSAKKAVRCDTFTMVIVDLAIPIEPKLSLLRDSMEQQPEALVISIGKLEYLKKTELLSSLSSVVSVSSINSIPELLGESQAIVSQDDGLG